MEDVIYLLTQFDIQIRIWKYGAQINPGWYYEHSLAIQGHNWHFKNKDFLNRQFNKSEEGSKRIIYLCFE